MLTIKIKITKAIYFEYMTRDVYQWLKLKPGVNEVTVVAADELAEDAEFQAEEVFDRDNCSCPSDHAMRRAYASLAKNIEAALAKVDRTVIDINEIIAHEIDFLHHQESITLPVAIAHVWHRRQFDHGVDLAAATHAYYTLIGERELQWHTYLVDGSARLKTITG
jgi:hypothetical protein